MTNMDSNQLPAIFPTGRVDQQPHGNEQELTIPVDQGFFHVAKTELTPRELQLLELFAPHTTHHAEKEHLWYQILFEGATVPATPALRVIQVKLKIQPGFLKKEWLAEIDDMFLRLVDRFFIQDDLLLLIEEKGDTNYPVEEIFGLFQALDTDFDIYTQVFVGAFHGDPTSLAANFQEEQQIFTGELATRNRQKDFPFTSTAINYFIGEPVKASPMMNGLYQDWFSDSEMIDILRALWQSQGNVSSAAKELFLHRNTVLYRIDKFQEATRLDLKNMNDLVFCHLLIEIFADK